MLGDDIREKALALGFGDVGFTNIAPFAGWAGEIERRMRAEPGMRAVWGRYRIASDPLAVMPAARTVVVLVWPFVPYGGAWPEGYLQWSAYYECWTPGRRAVGALIEWLGERGVGAVDADDHIPLKEAAERAGLGAIGFHQLLITPRWGSCVYLDAVLIDREIREARGEMQPLSCRQCQRCVQACPTQALDSDGTFHREKCLRHYMLSFDLIPAPVRERLGRHLVGCEGCQAVCPRNHGQYSEGRIPDAATLEPFSIRGILGEWETGLKGRMKRMVPVIGSNYARPRKVLTAALLSSRGEAGLAETVGQVLRHPHPYIRRYAAWALSYRPEKEAGLMLAEALAREGDAGVSEEIAAALDRRAHADI